MTDRKEHFFVTRHPDPGMAVEAAGSTADFLLEAAEGEA
jgi:hypothetical protein